MCNALPPVTEVWVSLFQVLRPPSKGKKVKGKKVKSRDLQCAMFFPPPAPGDFCCALVFTAVLVRLIYKRKVGGKHLWCVPASYSICGDSGGILTLDLQNRNLTLYTAKLRSLESVAKVQLSCEWWKGWVLFFSLFLSLWGSDIGGDGGRRITVPLRLRCFLSWWPPCFHIPWQAFLLGCLWERSFGIIVGIPQGCPWDWFSWVFRIVRQLPS